MLTEPKIILKVGDRVRITQSIKNQLKHPIFQLPPIVLRLLEEEFFTIKGIIPYGRVNFYQLQGTNSQAIIINESGYEIGFSINDFEEDTTCNCPLPLILARGCQNKNHV